MNRLSRLRVVRIGVVGALGLALGLAGCGRKGGLDPPPGAAVTDPTVVAQPAPPVAGPDGQPLPSAQPQRQRTPIDWLLD